MRRRLRGSMSSSNQLLTRNELRTAGEQEDDLFARTKRYYTPLFFFFFFYTVKLIKLFPGRESGSLRRACMQMILPSKTHYDGKFSVDYYNSTRNYYYYYYHRYYYYYCSRGFNFFPFFTDYANSVRDGNGDLNEVRSILE